MLQLRIVISVDVVEPNHIASSRGQGARHMVADEAGRAGDQNGLLRHNLPILFKQAIIEHDNLATHALA